MHINCGGAKNDEVALNMPCELKSLKDYCTELHKEAQSNTEKNRMCKCNKRSRFSRKAFVKLGASLRSFV